MAIIHQFVVQNGSGSQKEENVMLVNVLRIASFQNSTEDIDAGKDYFEDIFTIFVTIKPKHCEDT